MMRYSIACQNTFKRPGSYRFAFIIACMKLTGAIFTELINMFKMGQASSVDDIVKDFIAFGIISEIDDLMVMTLSNIDIEHEIEQNSITYNAKIKMVDVTEHLKRFVKNFQALFLNDEDLSEG